MRSITYEQFADLCKRWNYTIDEGYGAICFVSDIISQYCINCTNYEKEISNKDYSSTAFNNFVKTKKENVLNLVNLYGKLDNIILGMLEDYDEENKNDY